MLVQRQIVCHSQQGLVVVSGQSCDHIVSWTPSNFLEELNAEESLKVKFLQVIDFYVNSFAGNNKNKSS